jgi:hypothetical protein
VNSTLKLERIEIFAALLETGLRRLLLKLPAKYVKLKVSGPSKFVQRKFSSHGTTRGTHPCKTRFVPDKLRTSVESKVQPFSSKCWEKSTEAPETRRVQICKELLKNPNDERFLKRIVTCDENVMDLFEQPKPKKTVA